MRRGSWTTMLLALTATALLAATAAQARDLTVRLEVKGPFYRLGEPVEIRVTLENEGDAAVQNAEGIPLIAHLVLGVEEDATPATGVPDFDAASQPRVFLPGASMQQVVDLVLHFPAVAEAGTYPLQLKADGMESNSIDIILVPPYDPDLDYQAVFKTDFGDITFDLLEEVAPAHVQNFVDLARRGYYDDTLFHVIARGETIVGGDPNGDGSGGPGWSLQPEISNRAQERGTLGSYPPSPGGMDHGSQFFVSLRRAPERDGKFSIFGKMLQGEQALAALENVSTSGRNVQPYFRPATETFLRKVSILTAGEGKGGEDASGG